MKLLLKTPITELTIPKIPYHAKKRPYLVDPANRYHNYLEDVEDFHLEEFSRLASVTLQRISRNGIPGLFEPQPYWLGRPVRPKNWLVCRMGLL